MIKAPYTRLCNGKCIPIVGVGTWLLEPQLCLKIIKNAIDLGYRHIDGAHLYQNEKAVGDAIASKIEEKVVQREEMYVVSKLWNTYHNPNLVRQACETTLKNLNLSYIDLYLMHFPMGYKDGLPDDIFPFHPKTKTIHFSDIDYVCTWQEMEKLVTEGLTKSIGVANFNKNQISRLLEYAHIRPVMNQIENHPYLSQNELVKYCKKENIAITAYSPLGAPSRPWVSKTDPVVLTDPKIAEIAKKYSRSPAQICIRYQIERGNIVIPKGLQESHLQENIEVFDFALCEDEVKAIDNLNKGFRYVDMRPAKCHKYYPFHKGN